MITNINNIIWAQKKPLYHVAWLSSTLLVAAVPCSTFTQHYLPITVSRLVSRSNGSAVPYWSPQYPTFAQQYLPVNVP